jgi:hypothetical protein
VDGTVIAADIHLRTSDAMEIEQVMPLQSA